MEKKTRRSASVSGSSQGNGPQDDLALLLGVLPAELLDELKQEADLQDLVEVVLDLGRSFEARFPGRVVYYRQHEVTREALDVVVRRVGAFSGDNRAGIERTLHRISCIRNRRGDVIGLTCRVGRAITGTVDIIRDLLETGRSLLLLGPPGVGKTTLLREAARVLADQLEKRVVVVDTSNEIAGDGDVPHSGIGHARRMQVPSPERQHQVMIEAVENHMPEVIVIDEIGTELETLAARTIAERGVQLVATAHGMTLENLIMNPTLSDLVGGVQAVTLGDDEARRRGTQKTVLERKAPPTFSLLVEIKDRDHLAIHFDTSTVVDRVLAGKPLQPEVRVRGVDGKVHVEEAFREEPDEAEVEGGANGFGGDGGERFGGSESFRHRRLRRPARIFPIGVNRTRLERAIKELGVAAKLADQPINADIVLSLKAQQKRQPKKLQTALDQGVEFFTIKSNTLSQIREFLGQHFTVRPPREMRKELVDAALAQAEDGVVRCQRSREPVELSPQNSYLRRLQHELIQDHGLNSESIGRAPFRRVVVFP